MNHPDCAFAYSQARLQARLGARPTAADWQRMHAARDLAALLQLAGTSALAAWTQGLTARSPVHDAEQQLRRHWVACVAEVASWQPSGWRSAVEWLRWLPWLPALEKLARAGKSPDWMRSDPLLGPIVAEDPRQRAASLKRTACAPLAAGFGASPDVAGAWLGHWRRLWPADASAAQELERLVRHLAAHRRELADAPESVASAGVRARLDRRLLSAFRRNPLSPVATVAYLGIAAVDLASLRGAVAIRALRSASEDAA
jgi:hypothetical protein